MLNTFSKGLARCSGSNWVFFPDPNWLCAPGANKAQTGAFSGVWLHSLCLLRYLPHYYNGGTAAIWQTAGKLFQKKNAMNNLFIAFLIPYSIFSLAVQSCVQQRLRRCRENFDFRVCQLIQQRFKLHTLRRLALHRFTIKNLIHRDMIAGHQL